MAFVLLAGVLALTCTPVCGSTTNVDAMACCERHADQPSSDLTSSDLNRDHCALAAAARQPESGNCSAPGDRSNADSSAMQCCKQGRLNYPQLKAQPSASLHTVLPVSLAVPAVERPGAAAAAHQALREAPLKILSPPLYALTATYRI